MESNNVPQYAPHYERKDVNLDEEIRLFTNSKDREKYDTMAGLYSIIILLENLEKAFANNAIPPKEYTQECYALLVKCKTAANFLSDSIPDIETFMNDNNLPCKAARHRIMIGVPATDEHIIGKAARQAFDVCEKLITLMDARALGRRTAVELMELMEDLPTNTESIARVRKWYTVLKEMKSDDPELSDEQLEQLDADLKRAYFDYRDSLAGQEEQP